MNAPRDGEKAGGDAGVMLTTEPDAGRKLRVVALVGGVAVHADTFDPAAAGRREKFVAAVAEHAPAATAAVRAELLGLLAAEDDVPGGGAAGGDGGGLDFPELDPDRVVRPDLFVTAAAAGTVVPRLEERPDGPAGRLTAYVRLADGSRHRLDLPPAGRSAGRLDLPGEGAAGRPLYVSPVPAEPTAGDVSAVVHGGWWSAAGRAAWLAGSPPPCPAELFGRVRDLFARFVYVPPADAEAVTSTLALWTLLTYFPPAFRAVPYLFLNGPPTTGKTRVLEVLDELTFRPLRTANTTAPLIFRTLHGRGGTLLLDEAERLGNRRDPTQGELTELLNAGYKRGGQASRMEQVGDNFRPVSFDVYGPKALANIAGLPPATLTRCVVVRMTKAADGAPQPAEKLAAVGGGWRQLRDALHALALDRAAEVKEAGPSIVGGLTNRAAELWGPLFALAELCERAGAPDIRGPLGEFARRRAAESLNAGLPDADATLLEALHAALVAGRDGFDPPRCREVLEEARRHEAALFERWTERGIGARLKTYGFAARRSGGRAAFRDHTPEQVAEVARRHGLELDGRDEPAPPDAERPPHDPFGFD